MNKLLHSNYIGSSQDKQPFFSTFLHFPKNFPPARGLCPLDSRAYAAGGPVRTAPEGAALWTPAGALPQTPRCWRISASPAGGTGAGYAGSLWHGADRPAKRRADRSA